MGAYSALYSSTVGMCMSVTPVYMCVCECDESVCVHMVTGSLVGRSMLEVNPVEPTQHYIHKFHVQ